MTSHHYIIETSLPAIFIPFPAEIFVLPKMYMLIAYKSEHKTSESLV